MKVLVTGATGFVGREVLQHLHGHTIRILGRKVMTASLAGFRRRFETEAHPGDIADAASIEGCCDGVEAVIHLVGIIREIGANSFQRVHEQGTRHLLAEARRAGVKRFIHMSALGTRPDARSRYHQSKWAAEEAVRQSGLDFTISRPSVIYGAQDEFVNQFVRLATLCPVLPVVGSGQHRLQPVPVEIVGSCFGRALSEPASIGRTLDVCGPDALTLNDLLDAVMAAVGRRRLKFHIPLPLARLAAGGMELLLARCLHLPPPLTRDQILMLQEDNVGDPKPVCELFRFQPISFREGLSIHLTQQ